VRQNTNSLRRVLTGSSLWSWDRHKRIIKKNLMWMGE
jgi:hypothetical protein